MFKWHWRVFRFFVVFGLGAIGWWLAVLFSPIWIPVALTVCVLVYLVFDQIHQLRDPKYRRWAKQGLKITFWAIADQPTWIDRERLREVLLEKTGLSRKDISAFTTNVGALLRLGHIEVRKSGKLTPHGYDIPEYRATSGGRGKQIRPTDPSTDAEPSFGLGGT